jgi:hypothetical protein
MNGQPAALFWSQEDEFGFRRFDMRALPVARATIVIHMMNYHMVSTLLAGAARALLLSLQHSSILPKDDVDLFLKTLLLESFNRFNSSRGFAHVIRR